MSDSGEPEAEFNTGLYGDLIVKKRIVLLIALLLLLSCLPACSAPPSSGPEGGPLRIVATIFPAWDWVRNVLGDNPGGAELTLLLENGVDMHSFQPSAADILKISACDLFIYVGGASDQWVEDALAEAVNPKMVKLSLLEALGSRAREEELAEGMEAEEAEAGPEYDEHIWLSLRNAALLTQRISRALEDLDGQNAAVYRQNTEAYLEKLNALDGEYRAAVDAAPTDTLLFADRFPFRYLTEDYGLRYYAAFAGCSAETEASFETVAFLAGKAEELDLPAVLTIDGTDHRLAETVAENTRGGTRKLLCMDSMQSVSGKDIQNGANYLDIMESNLAVLREALGA